VAGGQWPVEEMNLDGQVKVPGVEEIRRRDQ
jgi:hypothetical protein